MIVCYPELVDRVNKVLKKDLIDAICLFPKNKLEHILSEVDPSDPSSYCELSYLFAPYVTYVDAKPVLVLNSEACITISNDTVNFYNGKEFKSLPLGLCNNDPELFFLTCVNLCVNVMSFRGVLCYHFHLIEEFLNEVCKCLKWPTVKIKLPEVKEFSYTPVDRKLLSTYTFIMSNNIPLGELRVSGNELTVIVKHADGKYFYASSLCGKDTGSRRRYTIQLLCLLCGITLGPVDISSCDIIAVWDQLRYIACYGAFTFRKE